MRRPRFANDPLCSDRTASTMDVLLGLLAFLVVFSASPPAEGQLAAFLPQDGRCCTYRHHCCYSPGHVRIKLLWKNARGRPCSGPGGTVELKVGDTVYAQPGELDVAGSHRHPAWHRLRADLIAWKTHALQRVGYFEVVIDARQDVPMQHVTSALNAVVAAGIEDVTFAAPEVEY